MIHKTILDFAVRNGTALITSQRNIEILQTRKRIRIYVNMQQFSIIKDKHTDQYIQSHLKILGSLRNVKKMLKLQHICSFF